MHAMGRSKGIVEVHLEQEEVSELAECLSAGMPPEVKGVVSIQATKLFGCFSIDSALSQEHVQTNNDMNSTITSVSENKGSLMVMNILS